jgi:NTE family protein
MAEETSKAAITRDPILVDLALQGGGSHGAFTWGVLDRLLEESWLGIDGISGTSAGAMNAAVLVDGHAKGGAAGARTALENFWLRVSEAARFSPLRRGPLDVILGRWTLDSSPIYVAMDLMSHLVSPYDLNPMGKKASRKSTRFGSMTAIAVNPSMMWLDWLSRKANTADRPAKVNGV